MTQEQKARAYDEALEWMRKVYPTLTGADKEDAEHYFPELALSEDERIRKHIVEILKRLPGCYWYGQKEKDDSLAWLEKQKERKDFRKLYEDIAQSDWFKKAYVGKSLGEDEQKEQKPTWSEEDEKQIRQIERIVKDAGCTQKLQEQIHNWFKSLRPTHWKPTEEQMEAFKGYIEDFQAKAEAAVGGWDNFDVMIHLYEQLKKL